MTQNDEMKIKYNRIVYIYLIQQLVCIQSLVSKLANFLRENTKKHSHITKVQVKYVLVFFINQRRPVNYRKTVCEHFKGKISDTLCEREYVCVYVFEKFSGHFIALTKVDSLPNHVSIKPIKILDYRNVLQTFWKK